MGPSVDVLLQPFRLGPLALPNRIVMAPMTRRRADAANVPSPLAAAYYAQRASAGLIISEACLVSAGGASVPGSPGLYTPAQTRVWAAVVEAVHAAGGRIFAQLWHAGRVSDPAFLDGALPVAPSAVAVRGELATAEGTRPFVTPRALGLDELPALVASFAAAARRAREAGFDGVEIHAAQGYLLDQFLRDGSNHREDAYGGSVAGRARLLYEVVDAVSTTMGAGRVGVQLSPWSTLGDMWDSDPVGTFTEVAAQLDRVGLAYLHVFEPVESGGSNDRVSPRLRRAFHGPFIANGGYDAGTAAAALVQAEADLVSFGRAFIANPDLVDRLRRSVPLAAADPRTFYGGGAEGYTDYPPARAR
jgi:N-ethylmaleimide reductase